jgi:ADP-heptose:LPS heptosyltransferase
MELRVQTITAAHIEKGISYESYRALIEKLQQQNMTTGDNHSESLLNYTKLNSQRMSKWDKIFKPNEELVEMLTSIKVPTNWVVLTEAWCGDAAQNLPIIAKLASLNPNISLKLLLRDENMEVMDAYLTNGGRSIPKLIMLDNDLNEIGQWGPRPKPVQDIMMDMKSKGALSYDDFGVAAHTWYAKDRSKTLQEELIVLLAR